MTPMSWPHGAIPQTLPESPAALIQPVEPTASALGLWHAANERSRSVWIAAGSSATAVCGATARISARSNGTERRMPSMLRGEGKGAARAAPSSPLVADRCAGRRHAEDRKLATAGGEEREIRDVEPALVEDRARREVERIVARVVSVAREELRVGREHLDLVRLVRADPEVPAHVELDAVCAVERARRSARVVDGRAVREHGDVTCGAVLVHRDAQDPVGRRVRHVKEALRTVERDAVRVERREAVRKEQWVRLPEGLPATIRAHRVDRAGERIGDVQRALVVLGDRIRRAEAGGERRDRAAARIDLQDAPGAEVGHIETLARDEEVAQERGPDRHDADSFTGERVDTDVPREPRGIEQSVR